VTAAVLAGSMLGQALGDALGFVVEAQSAEVARDYVDHCLRTSRAGERSHPEFSFGQYSDDTQLARELVLSFLDAGGWSPVAFSARIAELFRQGHAVGAGPGTRSAALRLISGLPWSQAGTPAPYAGNGSAMRAGPLGVLMPDPAGMCGAAREQSRITHLDGRCAAGAIAVARAVGVSAGRGPIDPGGFLAEVAQCVEPEDASVAAIIYDLRRWASLAPAAAARQIHEAGLDPAHRHRWRGISAFVVPSVLWSLYAFLRSPDDYWETICTAIGVGGDTDTMAAMAGAISGARLGPDGLPEVLLDRVHDRGEWQAPALVQLASDAAALVAR
jgi:ADP-ribosylglycohydrolase